ncbi:MAG: transketolase [Dehalococcoidia bacterium]|nr:transketolase [Dehalococcoidia bacterium]
MKTTTLSVPELEQIARKLRRHVINMIARANSGHPGGSLSSADIVAALYFRVLRHRPSEPRWAGRDRFVLSKGHAAPILYAALAESGYFPIEELNTLRQLGSRLQGHPDVNLTPGVEMSSGSLGQGLSFGVGAALAARMDAGKYHTYVLLGDGECQEGQVWEAAMAGAQFKLDDLTAIIDHNGQQLDGNCCDIMGVAPLAEKFQAFGWKTVEIDGHSMDEVVRALEAPQAAGKPTAIIARTIKGKGVSFMERNVGFHGKAPNAEETERALKELA